MDDSRDDPEDHEQAPFVARMDRRASFGIAAVSLLAATSASSAPVPSSRTRNVRDYGAVGDGITDDTEAFNRATQADEPWRADLSAAIVIPAGRYRLKGSVYVRRGQSLLGEGWGSFIDATGATKSSFILGRGRSSAGRGEDDPGGAPVSLSGLMALGGSAEQGFVFVSAQGFLLRNLFLSATGMAIEIEGADGLVTDVLVDQCLAGIVIRRSQNLQFQQINFYLANYAVIIGDDCFDTSFSNTHFSYTRYASVLLADGARNIDGVHFSSCNFVSNEQFSTFLAHVYSRASNCAVKLSGCSFRNSPGYAVWQDHGVGFALDMENCLVDGRPTNPVYNRSAKSGGLRTGSGRYSVVSCDFRHLASPAVRIGSGLEAFAISGGEIANSADPCISLDRGAGTGNLNLHAVRGVARIVSRAGKAQIVLPDLGTTMKWRFQVSSTDNVMPFGTEFAIIGKRVATRGAEPSGGGFMPAVQQFSEGMISFPLPVSASSTTPWPEVSGHG